VTWRDLFLSGRVRTFIGCYCREEIPLDYLRYQWDAGID
jgi:hypothetical protein